MSYAQFAALWSGTCGALASSFAKLAFLQSADADMDETWWSQLTWFEIILRVIFLLAMIACNTIAVGTFVQGVEESGSVKGTALATAANCVVSALLGILVWKDKIQSFGGLGLVIAGVVILVLPVNNKTKVSGGRTLSPGPEQIKKD